MLPTFRFDLRPYLYGWYLVTYKGKQVRFIRTSSEVWHPAL
jgi:hypothetical protein